MRNLLKALALAFATVVILPRLLVFNLASLVLGRDRALESATESLSRVPGVRGQYLRKAFLARAGVACHSSASICFGTLLSKTGAVIEEGVYVGPRCHLGLVHLERDVLLGAGVHIPSGARTHGTDDVSVPIRHQAGTKVCVRVGAGTWVGSGAIILANVGRNCVIGAGSVVTAAIPDNVVAAGVPARVVRQRGPVPLAT